MKKIVSLFALFLTTNVFAAINAPSSLIKTFPESVHFFAANPKNSDIYATTDTGVLVIDTKTLQIKNKFPLYETPEGLDVSQDGTKIYVVTSSAQQLAVINVQTGKMLAPIALPYTPYAVKFANRKIYATVGNSNFQGIMQIDAMTNHFIQQFANAGGVTFYKDALLQTSPDHKFLYYADVGMSPGSLAKYDISQTNPTLVYLDPFGSLGSNGQDLKITNKGDFIYYVVGSGNGVAKPYDVARIRTKDMTIQGDFGVGPYPHVLATSPDGNFAYINATSSGAIQVWNTQTQQKLCEINTTEDPNQLIVDKSGAYLFAAFQNELRVYSTSC